MVVYYLNKVSERLADYRYPIKEGDICMLYDGDAVKTIYVDSETETDSIWRDFKFIDSKSLKSYHLPKTDSVLCAPVGDKHAIGDTALLTQLIQECKGEWLLDFLNETSAVLSGFVDYWDLMVLRRLTGDDDIEIAYGDEEALSAFIDEPNEDDEDEELEDEYEEEYTDVDILPKSYDIKWFCLSALSCIEGLMDKRSYQILHDTLQGDSRSDIASRFHLTQERIRQIVVKATKQAKELLIEQRQSLEEAKAENAKLRVQMNLLREDLEGLKKLVPQNVFIYKSEEGNINAELTELLETPLKDINLPVRATNILLFMKVSKFADIPQIESSMKLLKVRNSGRKTLLDVSHFLEDFHLTFGMSLTEIVDVLKKTDWHDAKRKWIGGSEEEEEEDYLDEDESYETVDDDDSSLTDDIDTEEEPDDAEEASLDDLEVEHVFVDRTGRRIDSFTTKGTGLEKESSTENRRGKPWTEEEEDALRTFFNQGRDASTIAAIMGRTEVAIKSRLGIMGLIDYTYGQEEEARADADKEEQEKDDESDFAIENSFARCFIVNKRGDRVFQDTGKLKYIGGKLYRMNLKEDCFTLKSMRYDGAVWTKGEKRIVAYPPTALYKVLESAVNYYDEVEEIVDAMMFEKCQLKVGGVWYRYDGSLLSNVAGKDEKAERVAGRSLPNYTESVVKSPLYAVRKQAVLRAMGYFRLPASVKDIARTISRTAWRADIREDEVEDVISTMSEIESVDGKYVLRKGR